MYTQLDTHEAWTYVLEKLRTDLSKATFSTWFKDTHITHFEDGTITVGVPNQFVKDWLTSKYHKTLLKLLREYSEHVRAVDYTIALKPKEVVEKQKTKSLPQKSVDALPLQELYVNKVNNLNPRYTFDTFIVGTFNELAHAAARAIIENPGSRYNPFFIYGQTGFGKTHLIQAIGNEIKAKYSDKKIYYVTSERFTQDLVNSIQLNTVNKFKERYRQYDVLIMDDIQFLSNKEKTQEELFHLFNEIYERNGQIIFSSDKHPNYVPGIADRLKSRFAAGMTVDIQSPDEASRMAIIQAKINETNLSLEEDVIEYLAEAIDGNIREIEGAINSLVCQIQLKKRDLSVQEVKEVVKNSVKPKKMVSVPEVVKLVSGFYNIEEDLIYKKTRKKEVVRPRQLIMYILREDFSLPYPTIGQKIGGRDHTTVIHSCEKIKRELETDAALEQAVTQIRALL